MQALATSGTSDVGYITLSEAVNEVIFLRQVQDFMKPSIRLGAVHVFEDNKGSPS